MTHPTAPVTFNAAFLSFEQGKFSESLGFCALQTRLLEKEKAGQGSFLNARI
jgi:hypothetical protein